MDPSWNKPSSAEEQLDSLTANDLHIHIAPQKTNGAVRLSIIGERNHQQLLAKTELGVLHIPLGNAIAACTNFAESRLDNGSPMFSRWFPLSSPRGVHVEGDRAKTHQSDTEKVSDSDFQEYFAPCIQLAIIWSPDVDDDIKTEIVHDDESMRSSIVVDRSHSAPEAAQNRQNMLSPSVRCYFNADIGLLSVALIDSQRTCELLSLSVQDIDVRYCVTKAKTRVGVIVGWLQLDYQDDNVREPVVLAPTPNDLLGPVIQTLALMNNIRSATDVVSFDFIDVSIAEFDFTIEERLLFDLFRFFRAVRHRKGVQLRARAGWVSEGADDCIYEHRTLMRAMSESDVPTLLSPLLDYHIEESRKDCRIYVKELFLGVIRVNLSYLKGKSREGGLVAKTVDQVLSLAGGEFLEHFFPQDEDSDAFLSWSQHTYDDERNADYEGTLIFRLGLCAGSLEFLTYLNEM